MDDKPEVVPPVPAEAAPAEPVAMDPAELRKIVGLPPEAPDSDLITQLAMIISAQKQHIDAQTARGDEMENACKAMEGELANHFIAAYSDVLPETTHDFWRGQFITNRAATIIAVDAMAAALPVAPPVVVPAAPAAPALAPVIPLKNSLTDKPKSMEVLTAAPSMDAQQAAAILNRAKAIEASEKVIFTVAWERAQAELSKKQ
jgi:hypothetical protein